jgi:hypothetical protein
MAQYRIIISAALFPAPIGKARKFAAQIISFRKFFFIRCTLPIGEELIAGPIVLALHKGNERIGKAQTTIRNTLPIVKETAY